MLQIKVGNNTINSCIYWLFLLFCMHLTKCCVVFNAYVPNELLQRKKTHLFIQIQIDVKYMCTHAIARYITRFVWRQPSSRFALLHPATLAACVGATWFHLESDGSYLCLRWKMPASNEAGCCVLQVEASSGLKVFHHMAKQSLCLELT